MLNHEHIAALPLFPFLTNSYYQPSIYSNYIPLPYDATTRLIPIGQVPYQKEEYPHRFFVPTHTKFPFEYTHAPAGMINSAIVNKDPYIKKLISFPISLGNQGGNQNYDKELHTSEQKFNVHYHTSPIGINPENPMKIDKKKNDQSEQPNSTRDPKLIDHIIVYDLPNPNTANQIQKIQRLQSTTPDVQLDIFSNTYQTSIFPPIAIFNEPSIPELNSNSDSELPLSSDYHVPNEFVTVRQSLSHHSTTLEPSDFSNTEQLETTTGVICSLSTGDQHGEYKTAAEEKFGAKGSQVRNHLENNDTTKMLTVPIINIGEISTETAKSTQNPNIVITLSTPPTTTKLLSTPVYENTDSKISTPTRVTASKVETNIRADSYNIPVQILKGKSVPDYTRVSNEQDILPDLISLSTTGSSVISTVNSEPSTLPYKTTESSTIKTTSSNPYPKDGTTTGTSNIKLTTDKNNKIKLMSLRFTSLSPTSIRPLNITNSTTPILLETKTEQTPLITTDSNKYKTNIEQNTFIPRHHDESTRSYRSTSTILKISQEIVDPGLPVKTIPSGVNMYSNGYRSRIPTTTEKSNTNKEDKISTYFPVTTKETKRISLKPTVAPIKQHNSVQNQLSVDTVTVDSKSRKSTYSENRYTTSSSKTPRGIEDSELWYNHMYSQSPRQKDLTDEQIDFILKKIIKLLKPEIERQALTKESVARFVPPTLGDPEKIVYIIYPWVKDAAKNMENKERTEINTNPLSNDKLK